MSAPSFEPALQPHHRQWSSRTLDLDLTTDIGGEMTFDLQPTVSEDGKVVPLPVGFVQQRSALARDALMPETIDTSSEDRAPDALAAPQEKAPALAPGTVLADRYLLERIIGSGGTALVFRARDVHAAATGGRNRELALKVPRLDIGDRARAASRLEYEFRCAEKLQHPNIVRVEELARTDDGLPFFTMELVTGRTLAHVMRERSALPADITHRILRACADALGHAHAAGVVHGDFKPGNVLLGQGELVKVFDFGAAATTHEDSSARIPAGTPAYASPQVLAGEAPEIRDDVFSFACVAYELLTGQHPFDRVSSVQARDEGRVPQRPWSLHANQWLPLLSAMSWQREQRPTSIAAVLEALLMPAPVERPPAVEPSAAVAAAPEPPEDLIAPQRHWGFLIFAIIAIAVLLIAREHQSDKRDTTEDTIAAPLTESLQPSAPAPPAPRPQDPHETKALAAPAAEPARVAPSEAPTQPLTRAPQRETSARSSSNTMLTSARASAPALAAVSLAAEAVVTSESAIAAVFVLKRSAPANTRTRVQWQIVAGSAAAGEDFIPVAVDTVEFAAGQTQRAVYVPLRNDVEPEADETFTLRLVSVNGGRLGAVTATEAMIKDDD